MQTIKGSKILLFAPSYFGYEEVIKRKLIELGSEVVLIYENLDKVSHYYKFIKSKLANKMMSAANRYYIKQIKKHSYEYDYVFVIRGEYLSFETIKYMKDNFKDKCRYIMYQWDGVANNKNALEIAPFFDKVLTFDMKDSEQYGWIYRPLFYIDSYICNTEKNIDLLYICSLHSDRVRILNELKWICNLKGWNYKAILYEKKYIYLKRKYIDRKTEYINACDSDMTYKPLTIKDSYELYGRAKVIVDYTHQGQAGFTMRTIECVGNHCKMITNNSNIKNADFFNKNNIYVYDEKLEIPDSFISELYECIEPEVYAKYSIDAFLRDVF